ncbi:MAG: hypothetical protein IKI88_06585 [Anaerotignum sp.]|nr:hypothetical protein [Anaerotignum sp.]
MTRFAKTAFLRGFALQANKNFAQAFSMVCGVSDRGALPQTPSGYHTPNPDLQKLCFCGEIIYFLSAKRSFAA